MQNQWNDRDPIFLQIRDRIVRLILGGSLKPEEQLPSMRQVAAEYAVNPITVMKAYQTLTDEGILEKRRGLGMFIKEGAWAKLMEQERRLFMESEWPRIRQRIQALGLSVEELTADLPARAEASSSTGERA